MTIITPDSVMFVYAVIGAAVGGVCGIAIGLAIVLGVYDRLTRRKK